MAALSSKSMMLGSSIRGSNGVKAVAGRRALVVQAKVASKPKAKNATYVCVDCGYLYDGKRGPFEELPSSYACPVCGASKKRFKEYKGNVSRSNDNKTMAARREALREQLAERGESVGEDFGSLIAAAASAAVFLGAVYYFASSR